MKCILYVRFSPRRDAENCQSLEVQESRCRSYAESRGYEVVAVFREPETSGAFKDDDPRPEAWYTARPELYRAVESLRKEMILVVTKRDRIGRSVHGQGIVRLDVARHGCKIEAADEPNGDAPEDHLLQTMLAGVAEYERMLICARTRAAMQHHQAHGRRMSRADRVPYGFRPDPDDDSRIVPDDQEQQTLRILADYATANPTATAYDGCRHLDSLGVQSRAGNSWRNSRRTVGRIMEQARSH